MKETQSRYAIMKTHPRIRIGKDIGKVAIDVLKKHDQDSVMWGDCSLLDYIAVAYNKQLLDLHPLERHPRILSALERSGLFDKFFIRLNGKQGNNFVRCMKIKSIPTDATRCDQN